MSGECQIIYNKRTLLSNYHSLQRGDIICGIIPLRHGEEHILLDLCQRGIHLVPSASAQMASRSKAYQTTLLQQWMAPATHVIYDRNHLLEQISYYNRQGIEKVILKQDQKNAGLGILLYNSIEEIYNQAANDILAYPFVIQPFMESSTDLRVIIIGDYLEAYKRSNPHNFRNNLHCGGTAQPCTLSNQEIELCQKVMRRGDFPYAHLDLMVTPENKVYLTEINLRGGIHGAIITTDDYKRKIAARETLLAEKLCSHSS